MGEDRRLAAFEGAFKSFTACLRALTPSQLEASLEGGSPRQHLARLVGWNRLTVIGARAILDGKPAPYHADFGNDYASVNSELIARHAGSQPAALLDELERTKADVVAFLSGLSVEQWNADHGVRHPDGGPATVRRCLEELSRDYLDATDEINVGLAAG